jgi:hypothetical protein
MGFNSAFKGLKLLKNPGNGCLNNLNDPVLNVLRTEAEGFSDMWVAVYRIIQHQIRFIVLIVTGIATSGLVISFLFTDFLAVFIELYFRCPCAYEEVYISDAPQVSCDR